MIFLFFVQKFPKNWGKFGKFRLDIHLVIIQPKMPKNIKNHKCCGKILQIWGKFHFYIHLALHTPKLQKRSKTIENFEFFWKIPQNWEKIWEISSWYPLSHHRVQNFQKCQKPSKFLKFVEKSPKIERKFGKFYLGIHLALTYPKPSKNVKTHWKSWILLENPPKLRENLENFILIST